MPFEQAKRFHGICKLQKMKRHVRDSEGQYFRTQSTVTQTKSRIWPSGNIRLGISNIRSLSCPI
ncbi:uncharacterized protein PHALS_15026 [Plasmopara halstedii]|uniref:Uncharacterized protein n=1 Tax=Plasmopara halstedii TaxID=4781 RepID=A0A0P1A9B7_PLAHL|nr:uncharacterized protein PHALS_15026 [Plasmopara halstedii]CEG37120.1 hypothetical protein PHALS_15026 [Plasmopara halstedii]|eukprot:XP_024573489.1 hypothetical protein PHALS_15026 [Plasmopara halstedii]